MNRHCRREDQLSPTTMSPELFARENDSLFPGSNFRAGFFLFASIFLVYFVVFGLKTPFFDSRLEEINSAHRVHPVEGSDLVQQEVHRNFSGSDLVQQEVRHNFSGVDLVQREVPRKYSEYNAGRPPLPQSKSSKHRKPHFPCEIGFAKSVEYLIEPRDLMNFTQFSLEYIDREEKASWKEILNLDLGDTRLLRKEYNPSTPRIKLFIAALSKDHQISEFSKKHACFIMFVDKQTLSKLSVEGSVPNDGGNIGLWRIVVVRNLPYKDMRRTERYSIWLDSKMRLQTDPMHILEYFLWRTKSEYAISNHYDRHCVWEEVLQNKRLNKYNHTAINEQFMFYQSDGLTMFDPSSPNNPLPSNVPEGSFIVRAHTPMSNLFSCLWFNEVDRFTSRDQLSFAYTFLKLKRVNPDKPFYLNMFKDCERRALAKLFHHRVFPPPPAAP